ncbi:MAG: hypothetical protein NT161_03060 [Candidatus Nomurabacteria bacterium]|nr:hypothetical protein [Candidatus Nomurabacteria bacterium]
MCILGIEFSQFQIFLVSVFLLSLVFSVVGWSILEKDPYGSFVCRNHSTEKPLGEKIAKISTAMIFVSGFVLFLSF